jgi:hypothetical protein
LIEEDLAHDARVEHVVADAHLEPVAHLEHAVAVALLVQRAEVGVVVLEQPLRMLAVPEGNQVSVRESHQRRAARQAAGGREQRLERRVHAAWSSERSSRPNDRRVEFRIRERATGDRSVAFS